jgi:hypothetical protein
MFLIVRELLLTKHNILLLCFLTTEGQDVDPDQGKGVHKISRVQGVRARGEEQVAPVREQRRCGLRGEGADRDNQGGGGGALGGRSARPLHAEDRGSVAVQHDGRGASDAAVPEGSGRG